MAEKTDTASGLVCGARLPSGAVCERRAGHWGTCGAARKWADQGTRHAPYGRKTLYVAAADLPSWDVAHRMAVADGVSISQWIVRLIDAETARRGAK